MITKCKCGRNSTYGLTCVYCSFNFTFDPDSKKEAELPERESSLNELEEIEEPLEEEGVE